MLRLSEGFVGDPWLSITSTLCHILHYASRWFVLDFPVNRFDRIAGIATSRTVLLNHTDRPVGALVSHAGA
jgi:hypothetical protein